MEFSWGNARFNENNIPRALLIFLVISALWVVAVSATGVSEEDEDGDADTTPWTTQGQPGRFLLQNRNNGPRNPQRRNFCGGGRAPNFACRLILPWPAYRNPQCCTTRNSNRRCIDVGRDNDRRCGSCTRRCRFGRNCCGGVCVDRQTDPSNCGRCGNRCRRRVNCRKGICGYNGSA